MENQTYVKEFHLLPFLEKQILLNTSLFVFLYIFVLIINSVIITLIYIDNQLHTPMYLFLCNLALVDICYTTTTVPNLLHMLLSGDNTVSFTQCFTQMYFYVTVSCTEDLLIFIMAYDRYVAICHPLHYHSILSRKNCLFLALGTWISGCLHSILFTVPVSKMSFCHAGIVRQFFCDAKALINISCVVTTEFYIVYYLQLFIVAFLPFVFSLISYIKIIWVILQIKSKEGRKKSFSTCSSHLIILIIYYLTGLSVYVIPPAENVIVLEQVFTALYSVVIPMFNPLIYSLRNKNVKRALVRLLRKSQSLSSKGECMKCVNNKDFNIFPTSTASHTVHVHTWGIFTKLRKRKTGAVAPSNQSDSSSHFTTAF